MAYNIRGLGPIVWNSIPNKISHLPNYWQFNKAWRNYMGIYVLPVYK